MKSLAFALFALAALPKVWGQANIDANLTLIDALGMMSACAQKCIAEILPASQCSPTDQDCLCNSATLNNGVAVCLKNNCPVTDALYTKNLTATACHEPFRDRSPEYIRVSIAIGILSGIFIIQRIGYKLYARVDFKPDDWVALLAAVFIEPGTVLNSHYVAHNGIGRDVWTLRPIDISNFILYFFVQEILYFLDIVLLKITLLLFYLQIFPGQLVRRMLWATMGISIAYGVGFVVIAVVQCHPVSYYWHQWDGAHNGSCIDLDAFIWSNAALSISLDIWMLAIPLYQVKKLNLDWKRKVGVALMFGVGTFVTVVSILRLVSLIKLNSKSPNPTWDFYDIGIWSTVELNVGVVCVCMPSFRTLLVRICPKLQTTASRYYNKYRSSNRFQSTANSKSSRLGNSTGSSSDAKHNPSVAPPRNGITYETAYTVEYGDNDEEQLVYMQNLTKKGDV